MNLHEEISRIKSVMRILTEQSNTLTVSDTYTASNCDELHAFQSTGGKVIGNMNVIVGDKIKEWNSNGINVKPTSVTVSVNGMTVSWSVEFMDSDVNWVGFTSRGAGCNGNVDYRAGNDAINNGPKSVVSALSKQGKTVGKIEVVDEFKYDGGNNSFKQVFYRYTLVDNTSGNKPSPTTPQPQKQTDNKSMKKFVVTTTKLDKLNPKFKDEVSSYITSEGNKNYTVDYFDLSSEDKINVTANLDIVPNEKGFNKFSILLNPKGEFRESLTHALEKNPGSEVIKQGTIKKDNELKPEYEWHLVGLHV